MQVLESEYLFDPKFSLSTIILRKKFDQTHGALNPPIYMSSTFELKTVDSFGSGYFYSRYGNPTRTAVEEVVAEIEHNKYAIAFSSGMAAINCVLSLIKENEEIIAGNDLYGGTSGLLKIVSENHGVKVNLVDTTNLEEFKQQMTEQIKLIHVETPTNPTIKLTDIQELCQIAKSINPNVIIVVDNTFATPYLQTPADLGADITINSGTKYLGGHSDIIFGILSCRDKQLYDKLYKHAYLIGSCPSPFDCYLVSRSLKTLEVRMRQQIKSAYILAKYLESHPKIEKVLYPGLQSHPQYQLARKQMRGGGAMISFYIKGGEVETTKFMNNIHIFIMAVSLGGMESLIQIPAKMTHVELSQEKRNQMGLTQNFLRLSVGLENVDDLIQDLEQALQNI